MCLSIYCNTKHLRDWCTLPKLHLAISFFFTHFWRLSLHFRRRDISMGLRGISADSALAEGKTTRHDRSELLSTRYKVTDGLYSLVRRLMIPLAAVFAGILQHSHSTGFRSGATARIIFPPPRSAYGFKIGCSIVVPLHLECIGDLHLSLLSIRVALSSIRIASSDNHATFWFRAEAVVRKILSTCI